jgi:ubiquinone/menaquinone biosynthesis C-methylase UbiE
MNYFGRGTAQLYEIGIRIAGHKQHYKEFFSQAKLDLNDGDQILDAGCGSGLLTLNLAQEYIVRRGCDITIHAFDLSDPMLDLLSKHAKRSGLEKRIILYHGDGRDLTRMQEYQGQRMTQFSTGSFDMVMSSGMLEYITPPEAALDELLRVLKPGKQLIISYVNDNLLGNTVAALANFRVQEQRIRSWLRQLDDLHRAEIRSTQHYVQHIKSTWIGRKPSPR